MFETGLMFLRLSRTLSFILTFPQGTTPYYFCDALTIEHQAVLNLDWSYCTSYSAVVGLKLLSGSPRSMLRR
jgi:hypothetical protein